MIFLVALSLIAGYIMWTLVCLELNVQRASRMCIDCVRVPIDGNNVLWMLVEGYVWKVVDALPFAWASYPESFRYLRRGWHFREKASSHERHGPIWALITPLQILVHLSDPDAVGDVFARRRDFVRPSENYKILEVFGPCLSTADVHNWPRHRKALATPFNESTMNFVWTEALKQANAMSRAWTQAANGVHSVEGDTRSVSLNILAATGFRKSYAFHDSQTDVEEESYRAALRIVLDNVILLMLIPYQVLTFPLVPESWKKIGRAGDRFRSYMVQMLDEETKSMNQGGRGSGGIMTSLVRALDVFHSDQKGSSGLAKGLSAEEIFGNIFIINMAGHDTTANTLAFSLMLLAREPHVQDWMTEEIRRVTKGLANEEWTYELLFNRLHRCRAIIYETLRLYPPIIALPRKTPSTAQTLVVQDRSIFIPPNTGVTLSLLACQTDPLIWPDALDWKPSRWIIDQDGQECFRIPPSNSFFPWSDGPQNCLGKKFAEVESVAVLACLFQDHKVQVKANESEDDSMALKRLSNVIEDVSMDMLLKMKDPDRVRLLYTRR